MNALPSTAVTILFLVLLVHNSRSRSRSHRKREREIFVWFIASKRVVLSCSRVPMRHSCRHTLPSAFTCMNSSEHTHCFRQLFIPFRYKPICRSRCPAKGTLKPGIGNSCVHAFKGLIESGKRFIRFSPESIVDLFDDCYTSSR